MMCVLIPKEPLDLQYTLGSGYVNAIFHSIFHIFLYRYSQNLFMWKCTLLNYRCLS